MITHPANMIMTIVPRAVGAFAGLKRIQAFLLEPSLDDKRDAPPRRNLNGVLEPAFGSLTEADLAIHIQQLSIGRKELILENVNLKMKTGSFTIISGPTGCGKSTLLRAILGEVTSAHGLISLSTRRIAYCSQRPWIQAGTIREAICGFVGDYDEAWYYEVINACCLVHDIDSLRDGDHTQIGSRGLNLSGGQRQRVVCLPLDNKVCTDDQRPLHVHCSQDAIYLSLMIPSAGWTVIRSKPFLTTFLARPA